MSANTSSGPLAGVRIVDLTTVLMGPYATQILGDMGADVIKVESPGGDAFRYAGPARHKGMGALFLHVNRNKRSVVLDLKTAPGRAALLRLCATADVVAYNVRPQAMERLGLGYADVRAVNPNIIYAGMFGFGRDGAYAKDPAYDDLIQGLSGFPAMLGRSTGNAPAYVPANICDRTVGLYAVGVISAALYHRERSGQGQEIDIPMFETMAQFMAGDNLYGETFVPAIGGTGYARLMAPERRPFATSDGYLCVLPYTDRQWQAFFALAGLGGELAADPRFATMAGRTAHIGELYGIVARALAGGTTADWLARLKAADIPVARMHTIESLLEDEHLAANDFFKQVEHPSEGTIRMMDIPSRWSGTAPDVRRLAPQLGEHSAEVLAEAGYSADEIGRLFDQRISAPPAVARAA
ncbi:CaiB/BaiF CoA-transferase family protein [uncultured Massilia sp.]|uniref:CaiB/BaiF CoA transferase family protein n=1 Tax=uncultured Massilia sp. TaxID=169973 RepID=UPI0025FF4194|nr:CoA transferase [uncultured Massilia sp.]